MRRGGGGSLATTPIACGLPVNSDRGRMRIDQPVQSVQGGSFGNMRYRLSAHAKWQNQPDPKAAISDQ